MTNLNNPSQSNSQKSNLNSISAKLLLLLSFSFIFVLLLSTFASATIAEADTNFVEKINRMPTIDFLNVPILYRTAYANVYVNPNNSSQLIAKISSNQINLLDENGTYQEYSQITNFHYDDDYGGLILNWGNKTVKLKSAIIDNNKNLKVIDAKLKQESKFDTQIIKNQNGFYYNHTFEKTYAKKISSFTYDIETQNVDCKIDNYALICDEQMIDFSQAVTEQNLNIDLKLESFEKNILLKILLFFKPNKENSIKITGLDLSYIDPTVTSYSGHSNEIDWDMITDAVDGNNQNQIHNYGGQDSSDRARFSLVHWDVRDVVAVGSIVDSVTMGFNIDSVTDTDCLDVSTTDAVRTRFRTYYDPDITENDMPSDIVELQDLLNDISAHYYTSQYDNIVSGDAGTWLTYSYPTAIAQLSVDNDKSAAVFVSPRTATSGGFDCEMRYHATGSPNSREPYLSVTYHLPTPTSTQSFLSPGGYTSGAWSQGNVVSRTSCATYCTSIADCQPGSGCGVANSWVDPRDVTISTEGTSYYSSAAWHATYGTGTVTEYTIKIDTVNPINKPYAIANAAPYAFGTTTGYQIDVTLSCSDATSGCAAPGHIDYCVDQTPATPCTPNIPVANGTVVSVTNYGDSFIRYYSTDAALRTSTTENKTLRRNPQTITLNFPANGAGLIGNSTTLNCSAIALAGNINTLILYIDGIANTSISPGAATGSIQTTLNFSKTVHTWNCGANNSVGYSSMGTARSFLMGLNISTYSSSNNASTYETKLESFKFNISYDKTIYSGGVASFIYGGIDIADGVITVTDDTQPIERFINVDTATTVPDGAGNNSFYISLMLSKYAGGYDILNSSNGSISVNASIFGLCNSTNNVVYLNVTFKDQTAWTPLNMTLSVTDDYFWNNPSIYDGTQTVHHFFSNTSENALYQFCFDPASQPIILNGITMEYSATGYPSVPWSSTGLNLSNQSTQLVFYPCSTSVCAVSTLVITDTAGNYVDQAFLIISTILETVDPVVISTGYTDSSGAFTAFLNPLKSHSVTINKTGCVFTTRSFIPTSATATNIEIDCGTGGVPLIAPYSGIISGLEFRKTPMSGTLEDGMNLFELRVMSTRSNIQKIRMEVITNNATLLYAAEKVVGTPSCLNYDCYVNFTYNTSLTNNSSIKGRYFVDLGRGWLSLENDAWWSLHITPIVNISSNMKNFWTDMKDMFDSSGDYIGNKDEINRAEFTRIMWVFIIMCLLFAAFNKFSGYDSANPGAFLVLMTFVFVMGSAAGGITGQGYFYLDGLFGNIIFLNNYIISIYMILITLTYFLNIQRRNS